MREKTATSTEATPARPARPTLKDVAELSGYGLRTTKKVMGGKEPVALHTRERVLAAAKELGYRKNSLASALALAKSERIAVVYSEVTKGYFPEVERGFRTCAREYRDYGLEIDFHKGRNTDPAEQVRVLERLLADESVSGVILQPVSQDAVDPVIRALSEAGKPVITFGSDAPASGRLSYIGPNAYKSGRIGAQILANYVGRSGAVLVIGRGQFHMQTRERRHGFHDVLDEQFPQMRIVDLTLDDGHQLRDRVREAIETTSPVGIFATYADSVTPGGVLKELGRDDIVLVGFDLSAEAIALMREGFVKVILEQGPENFAYRALKMMFEYRYFGTTPPDTVHTDVSILTSECLP